MEAGCLSRRAVIALVGLGARPVRASGRDVVRVGVLAPRGIGSFDPQFATAHHDRMLASWLHGALVRFRPGSADPRDIGPDLAERWEASRDRREWVFHLRRGVAFHRGFGAVTAGDVVFSLRKAATAATSGFAGDFAAVEAVEALDEATVRVGLREAVPSLLGLVSNYAGGFVLSRRAMEAGGAEAGAVGFGPFALEGHVPGQVVRLTAHDRYFRGRARLRRVEVRLLSSAATADLAFGAGELDVVEGQADQAWIERVRRAGAVVDVIGPAEISWLHLNVARAPLDDPRVRRAVALAVNRAELVRWRGADVAQSARGVLPVGMLGFSEGDGLPGTDVAEARRLLASAGYPEGLTLRTVHTGNPGMLGAIQVVQAQLRRAGIALEVQVVDHLTYHQMIRQDLSPVVHYAAARFPVADAMLTPFFHSRSIVGTATGVTNFSHCAVADAEIEAARGEVDPEAQLQLWADAQRKILRADCAVPLMETTGVWARRAGFDYGFEFRGAMSTGPLLTEASGW